MSMKKINFLCFFMILILIVGVSCNVLAAPVGNPARTIFEVGDTSVRAGGLFDVVLDKDLDEESSARELRSVWGLGVVRLNIFEPLQEKAEIYGFIGIGDVEVKRIGTPGYTLFTSDSFAMGGGATIVLWETDGGLVVGMDGKFRMLLDPKVDKVKVGGNRVAVTGHEVDYKEWQAAIVLTQDLGHFLPDFDNFYPYAGIKYSDVELDYKFTEGGTEYKGNDLDAKNLIGTCIGIDVIVADFFSFNVEGRLIDEYAINFGCTLIF